MFLQIYWTTPAEERFFLGLMALTIILMAILLVVCCYVNQNSEDEGESNMKDQKTVEREIRYLVICPYCGAKNPQGQEYCKNCDGNL